MSETAPALEAGAAAREPVAETRQYLTFLLAGEEYGVDILRVKEIRGWEQATPIPSTPSYVKGVINLRGTIVPIIDLRERLGMETVAYGPTTVVIVLCVGGQDGRERVMGVVVDAVSEVYDLAEEDMRPPPEFGAGVEVDLVRALATVGDKMVIVLDIDRMLGTEALGAGGLPA